MFGAALMGALFLVSAWFKLFPIEPFEYKIVGTTFFSWLPAVFVARIVIAGEFGIGLLLLFSYRLKDSLRLAMLALVLFSVHLVFVLVLQGNTADCGCMGSLMQMTPLQGLIKNAGLLLLSFVIYRHAFHFELKIPHLIPYVLLVSAALVFIVNPVDPGYSETYLNKPYEGYAMELDTLYNMPVNEKADKPVLDIRGKKMILAFVSASCPHCRIAAQKIAVIKRRNPAIPFYFFVNGDPDKIDAFLMETETAHIPHSKLNGPLFIRLAGLNLPVICYYNKGRVERQVDYFTLEQYHIEQWLGYLGADKL